MAQLTTEHCPLHAWKKACGLPPECENILIQMPLEDIVSVSYEDPEQAGVWHKCAENSIDIELAGNALKIVAVKGE